MLDIANDIAVDTHTPPDNEHNLRRVPTGKAFEKRQGEITLMYCSVLTACHNIDSNNAK